MAQIILVHAYHQENNLEVVNISWWCYVVDMVFSNNLEWHIVHHFVHKSCTTTNYTILHNVCGLSAHMIDVHMSLCIFYTYWKNQLNANFWKLCEWSFKHIPYIMLEFIIDLLFSVFQSCEYVGFWVCYAYEAWYSSSH